MMNNYLKTDMITENVITKKLIKEKNVCSYSVEKKDVYEYNDKNQLIKETSYDKNNDSYIETINTLYGYDNEGRIINATNTFIKNDDIDKSFYYYNEKNQLILEKYIEDGEIDTYVSYEYDNKGNVVRIIENGEVISKYHYTENNDIFICDHLGSVIRYVYDDNNRLELSNDGCIYHYNEKELLSKVEKLHMSITFTYDEDDDIKLIEYKDDGKIYKTIEYTYY